MASPPPYFPAAAIIETKPVEAGTPCPSLAIDSNLGIRCIDDYEPRPQIFGRAKEVETIVQAMLAETTVLVAGGPGMGKTAVATAAFYDPRLVARFNRRRIFASLETATEARAILAKLVEALGLTPTGDHVSLLRILESNAAEKPFAAILDNAETVFDSDREGSERLLNLVARIRGLSLTVTIRGVTPPIPGAAQIDDLPKLPPDDARAAFLAIAGASFSGDPDLDLELILEALDGHALSIRLVAAQAIGSPSLEGLRESWDEVHAEILRRSGEAEGRLTSVRASLALSLNSQRMKSIPLSRRLMALLAFLPGGLAEGGARSLLGERGTLTQAKVNEAVVCLRQLQLVERRPDRRLRMLTPLRESVKSDVLPMADDQKRIIAHYLTLASRAYSIGSGDWERYREDVEAEADNLDSVCELAVATNITHKRLEDALAGLGQYHVFSGRGDVGSIDRAAIRLRAKAPSRFAANCIEKLADIARVHSDNETANTRFQEALTLYRRIGNARGEATCIKGLGNVALARSDYQVAMVRFEEARVLYRRVKDVFGEANCVRSLGDIALSNSDQATSLTHCQQALILYRSIGGVLGEAYCNFNLGEHARFHSDYKTARGHYEDALRLHRRVGNISGEAGCILRFGDISTASSEYEFARPQYQEALILYRRVGDVSGEASCILALGELARIKSDYETACDYLGEASSLYRRIDGVVGEATSLVRLGQIQRKIAKKPDGAVNIEAGFALYFKTAGPEDRALPGWRAMHRALTCEDAAESQKHRELARSSWTEIRRLDLVVDWVDWT